MRTGCFETKNLLSKRTIFQVGWMKFWSGALFEGDPVYNLDGRCLDGLPGSWFLAHPQASGGASWRGLGPTLHENCHGYLSVGAL